MRRRRKQRSTWFPVLGTETSGESNPLSSVYNLSQTVELGQQTALEVTPLIPDWGADPNINSDVSTLRDFVEGQTCLIDRIVGKIYVACQQIPGSGEGFVTPREVVCCAAIAVLPVDNTDIAVIGDLPDEISPLAAVNLDKPWMWRRTWTLGNWESNSNSSQTFYPRTNAEYGSVMDGPHLDTKGTKRAIQKNERIFLLLANQDITPGEPNENTFVRWTVDLRVLGRMTKSRSTKALF